MKKAITGIALLAGLLFTAPVLAASAEYTFDPNHTQIIFSASHLGFSHSHGKFNDFAGGFVFDPAKPEDSKIDITIKTASIDLDDEKWNEHMRSADFLNAAQFPDMTFKSTKVVKTGENTGTVTGDLTLLGVTRPVTLDVIYNKSGVHPYSQKSVAGFSATGTVKRSDFGMTYGLPAVGDDVALNLQVEGIAIDKAAEEVKPE